MWFFSKLRDLFSLGTEEVVFSYPPHSELSNPRCLRLTSQLVQVLRELSNIPHPITANKFNKISSIPSADKRLNELKKLWYIFDGGRHNLKENIRHCTPEEIAKYFR